MKKKFFVKEFGGSGSVIGHFTKPSIEGLWFYEGFGFTTENQSICQVHDNEDEIDEDEIDDLKEANKDAFERAAQIYKNTLSEVKKLADENEIDSEDSLVASWFIGHEHFSDIKNTISTAYNQLEELITHSGN